MRDMRDGDDLPPLPLAGEGWGEGKPSNRLAPIISPEVERADDQWTRQ
jgi:hypothetical protein